MYLLSVRSKGKLYVGVQSGITVGTFVTPVLVVCLFIHYCFI